MTELEQYNAMSKDVQILIDDYIDNLNFADDCLMTLLSIYPEKECSMRALAEAYADYKHTQLSAKEQLERLGVDSETAYKIGMMKLMTKAD